MAFFDPAVWDEASEQGERTRIQEEAARKAARLRTIEDTVANAVRILMDARRDGQHQAHLGTVTEFERDCIEPHLLSEDVREWVSPADLRGPWAQLRDELAARRILLSLRWFVRGQRCNDRHWACDITAKW